MAQIFESEGTVWIKQEPVGVEEEEEDPLGNNLDSDPIKEVSYDGENSELSDWPNSVDKSDTTHFSEEKDESKCKVEPVGSPRLSENEESNKKSPSILKSAVDLSCHRNEENPSAPKKPRITKGSSPQLQEKQQEKPPGAQVNPNVPNPLSFLLNKRLMCKHCDFVAATPSDLRLHTVAAHRDIKILLCPHCEYTTKTSTRLKNHIMARHTKEKPLSCPFCDYCTIQTSNLKNHITARHATLRQVTCQHCSFACSDPDQMKNHVSSTHETA